MICMYILGVSCFYHDSAACLIKDGKIIAGAEEERFTRKKHDNSFPQKAIEYCLKEAGITAKELDYVSFYEKPLMKFERILYSVLQTFPNSFHYFYEAMPSMLNEKLKIPSSFRKKFNHVFLLAYLAIARVPTKLMKIMTIEISM